MACARTGAPIRHFGYDVGPLGMPAPVTRLRSVDAFRGLTMAGMVIVNNPGDWNTVYPPLLHAEWHGWTPTDLIFPWFLVIMGVSMALAGPERAPWPAVLRRVGDDRRPRAVHVRLPVLQSGAVAHSRRAGPHRPLLPVRERRCGASLARPTSRP